MSLFVVNRYEGENAQTDENQDHLSELLERIALRKRERELAKNHAQANEEAKQDQNNDAASGTPIKHIKENKSRKRKLEASVPGSPIKVANTDIVKVDIPQTDNGPDGLPQESFTILGAKKRLKAQTVKPVLPHWLSDPEIVDSELKNGPFICDLDKNLDSRLLKKLEKDGFEKLFPVQACVLPWLLQCDEDYKAGRWVRDTCVCMPTGSGKTLTYALPIIQILQNCFKRLVRCLIVLPVQELALQVFEVFHKYCEGTLLKIALTSGASPFKEEQERLVQKNENGDYISRVDIVISTPGRLVDHLKKTAGFSLSALRFLVIDEADRATDWLQYIPPPHSKAPPLTIENLRSSIKPAQKLLLSATLSQDPEKLSRLGLFRPILFTSAVVDFGNLDKDINLDEHLKNKIGRYGNPSELKERIIECSPQHKPVALYHLLMENGDSAKTLIFTNSSEAAHRLAVLLKFFFMNMDVIVAELSAQLGSKKREETLEKFKQGIIKILVSSDALARGLDIPGIELVVSYDLPKHIKGYIHRAGRTGRGGFFGTAVSLLLKNQISLFERMMGKVGKSLPSIERIDLDEIVKTLNYEEHLENLKTVLGKEREANIRQQLSKKTVKRKKFRANQ